MKVIIFGGLGYLGSNLVRYLKTKKFKVFVYSNKKFNNKSKHAINYIKEEFEKKIRKINPKIIFFFSGNSNPRTSKNHIYDLQRSNIPLQNFLEAAKNIKFKGKIFFSSSIAVYGNLNSRNPIKENKAMPVNFYGLSKLLAEQQLRFYSNNFGLKIMILRISSFFGPRLPKQFIYHFTKKAILNKVIKLSGHISDKRELLSIEDLVKIIAKLINKKFEFKILNIGPDKQIKISILANKILKILKIKKKIKFENKLKSPDFPKMSTKKLKKIIGNKIETDFDINLEKTINYIKQKYE